MPIARVSPARLALVLLAATTSVSCATQPGLGFDLFTLAAGLDVSAPQGGSGTTTVSLSRADNAGQISLDVTGLPSGVTADINPNNDTTATSIVITLTVGIDVAPGQYPLRVTGKAGDETHADDFVLTVTATPHFRLSLSSTVRSVAQAGSVATTVTIDRSTFPGGVTLSTISLPTGVTADFAPANPQLGNSVVMTLTAAPTAPTGIFEPIQLQGTGAGIPGTQVVNFTLAIDPAAPAGDFSLSTTPPSPVSLVQGASAPVTVNINHTGGNTSNVALSSNSVLPTGMTLSFLPASTTLATSVLTVATTAATPVGSYPIVIHGIASGLAVQAANLTINVTAPPAPVPVTVSFASCPAANKAVWLAFLDGTTGTWTAVTGAADVYHFSIAQSKGSLAWVALPFGTAQTFVRHMTQAELGAGTITPCGAAVPAGKNVNGIVAGLTTGMEAQVAFAGASRFATANGAFQMTNAMNGSFDLIGFARFTSTGAATRAFIARGENPAAGGSFSVPVDFAHVTRSTPAVAGAGTVTGLTGGETELYNSMLYYTGGAACVESLLYAAVGTPPSFTFYGIPASLRAAGDMHGLQLRVVDGATSSRSLTEAFVDVTARAATPFLLPPPLPAPTALDAGVGGPYKRPSVSVSGVPAVYDVSHTLFWIDDSGSGEQGTVTATSGWVGGSGLTLVLPNFHGVGTFNDAWAPAPSDVLDWNFRSAGGGSGCAAGLRMVSATRVGVL